MERRAFFHSLIAAGAPVKVRPESKNRRRHHDGTRMYHGPMAIPERIAAIIAEHPAIKRTTHQHLASRYSEGEWTYLFRCQIPEHRLMIGEIWRTPEGRTRVHCWSAADPERYTRRDEPAAIIAAKPTVLALASIDSLNTCDKCGTAADIDAMTATPYGFWCSACAAAQPPTERPPALPILPPLARWQSE